MNDKAIILIIASCAIISVSHLKNIFVKNKPDTFKQNFRNVLLSVKTGNAILWVCKLLIFKTILTQENDLSKSIESGLAYFFIAFDLLLLGPRNRQYQYINAILIIVGIICGVIEMQAGNLSMLLTKY